MGDDASEMDISGDVGSGQCGASRRIRFGGVESGSTSLGIFYAIPEYEHEIARLLCRVCFTPTDFFI